MALKEKKQTAFDGFLAEMKKVLPPAKYAALESAYRTDDGQLDEKAADHTAVHVMLRSDYMNSNAELNKAVAELNSRQQALDNDLANIAAYETKLNQYEQHLQSNAVNRADYEAIQSEMAQLQAWKNAAVNKLNELEAGGLLEGLDTSGVPTQQAQPAKNGAQMPTKTNTNGNGHASTQNPIEYVTPAQLATNLNQFAFTGPVLAAQLNDIAAEYLALTGKQLPNQEDFLRKGVASGKELKQYANEVLNLTELRSEKQKADYEAEMSRRVQAELSKITSEGRLPTNQAPREVMNSPFMSQMLTGRSGGAGEENGDVISGKPQHRPGVAAARATEAYLQHKYANERNPYGMGG